MKSYPYLSDVLNSLLGTNLSLPVPMFGLIVLLAIVVASIAAASHIKWKELQGSVPEGVHGIVPDIALVCGSAGIVGARVFYIADHLDDFFRDPGAMILTRSGFSIYGGLVFGLLVGVLFLKRRRIPILPTLDAFSPSLMLGYGIGRLACQVVGDGDWGVVANMSLKPDWVPVWMWAQSYEGNILGVVIPDPGVYPTPLYELTAAIFLFTILWARRSRPTVPGHLFSLYLLLAGFERLLIEKIRINIEHNVLGLSLTQAEMISLVVIGAGLCGVLLTLKSRRIWIKVLISLGIISAASACVPW